MRRLRFFIKLQFWFSLRQMRAHYWRVLAVLFGIAIGAAVFTSIRLAVDASLDSFTQSMSLVSGKTDWVVTRPGGRVPEGLVARLNVHPAVETASPLLTSYIKIFGEEAEPFLLIGMDPILDRSLRGWQVKKTKQRDVRLWLDLVREPNTVILSQRLAQRYNLKPADIVTLEHIHQVSKFRILDTLQPQSLALVNGGQIGLADISTMQEFTGLQGLVDQIDLRLKPNVTGDDLADLKNLLPPGIILETPTRVKETGDMMIRAYQLNLSLLSFVSLFVGMFLVYSLVALNAASRRREVAILRSLGGSKRLIFLLVLSEGLFLGIVGWLLAIPIGSILVKYMVQGVSSTISHLFVRVHVDGLRLDPWEILLSFCVTVFICLLAAYGPAREATSIAPREALFLQDSMPRQRRFGRQITLLGLLLIALAWPLSKLPALSGVSVGGYTAIFFLVLGSSFLSLWILQWMGSVFPPLLSRLGGEPAFLGGRFVRDAGRRTAVSVGALVTAMALFVALVIMIHSFRSTVALWVNQTLAGDLLLRPKMAGFNQYRDHLPEDVVRGLRALPDDVQVLPFRQVLLHYAKTPYQIEAIDIKLFLNYGSFLLLKGNFEKIVDPVMTGQGVLVSEVFASQTGLKIGQRYRAQFGKSIMNVPILGIVRDYRTRGGVVYTALEPFQRMTGNYEWSGARIFFKDRRQDLKKSAEDLKAMIFRDIGQSHPLEIISGEELRREILRIFDETFAITTVLLLIALLVAGLGITTTLTVLVLERIRQLNTMVAVGASAGQIRSMIFWEAVLMVMAGESLGLICGFFMSYILIYVINRQSFGWTFLYQVDWSALLVSIPLILATALIAALPATLLVLRSSPALVLKES
ncbi:MAG: ABC transporter permease [Deltaproteobacteria bacterium]|nr:ABC transporter permease [Deltaproteobacteria bacterium]